MTDPLKPGEMITFDHVRGGVRVEPEPDAWAKLYGRRGDEPLTDFEKHLAGGNERDWLREVQNPDLNRMHHALRMLTTHSMTSKEEKRELEELADACWDEGTRRSEGPE